MRPCRLAVALALFAAPWRVNGPLAAQTGAPAAWQATPASILKSALRAAVVSQTRYHAATGRYADAIPALGLSATPGVQLEILHADPSGWVGKATHQAKPGRSCVVFAGSLAGREPPRTDHDGEMAGEDGIPLCDWMP
jgi:hypothetical protein